MVSDLAMALHLAGDAPLLIVWGGLGFSRRPIRELKELYTAYPDELSPLIQRCDAVLQPLLVEENVPGSLAEWMTADSKRSPALSPTIAMVATSLLHMARYVLLCKILGKTPGEMARSASAFTGHSVGLLCATNMAVSDSWDSLYDRIEPMIAGFCHGIRCAKGVWDGKNLVPVAAAAECTRRGEGTPSPMLSVVGLPESRLTEEMNLVNETLPDGRKLHIVLINEPGSYVAAGGPEGLIALCSRLRAPSQGFGLRDNSVYLQFIPVSLPFHSPHLYPCTPAIARRTEHFTILRGDLLVPVWGLDSFLDAKNVQPADNIAPLMGALLFPQLVDFPAIMASMTGRWQVLDLGPGGTTGIGSFIQRIKSDPKTKIYTVLPSGLSRRASPPLLCAVSDDPNPPTYQRAAVGRRFIPPSAQPTRRLPRSRFTDLLGLPRVLVAGMTPTTCDVDFVAAVMNAGYYVEFAAGGYHDPKTLESAITCLASKIPSGRLITLNLIYGNPRGVAWMIPQIAALVRQGFPIGGLTIGAGVPDAAVVAEWVKLLELSYIGFKPSSTATIRQVLDIARAHPTLPVMLQWTGGRAGGHHSREDFHEPILETYQAIREVPNVILVGGSGFGDVEGSWPYVSGDWSREFGRPLMPFDAILVGTCMMTTREAKTSPEAKRAMVEAAGVRDEEWPGTLQGGAGGAISIISHLGESMHVLATRGMRLWAEFDQTLFNLSKDKMVAALETRRDSIIASLNNHHQKVWFGFDYESMSPADLEDMTYISVLRRLLDLTHPIRTGKWTDPSYQGIVEDWMTRILERFAETPEPLLYDADPRQRLQSLAMRCPEAGLRFLSLEDKDFFIKLAGQRGRKPVPFIPVLDADFAVWFKKDPLWQSENLDATFHGDVERVCILAGPVALQHCVEADVSVATFLDSIARGYADKERGLGVAIPPSPLYELDELILLLGRTNVSVEPSIIRLGQYAPGDVDNDLWLQMIGNKLGTWGRDLFGTRKLHGDGRTYHNPMRRIFAAQPGAVVEFSGPTEDGYTAATLYGEGSKGCGSLFDAKVFISDTTITTVIPNPHTAYGQTANFELKFDHVASCPYAPVVEEQKNRVDRVAKHIGDVFFGVEGVAAAAIPAGTTQLVVDVASDKFSLWASAVDGQGVKNEPTCHFGEQGEVPMEYSTILSMKLLWQLLLERGWDMAKLLHRRTTIDLKKDQRPLSIGDRLVVTWNFDCLHGSTSGIDAKFHMDLSRDGAVAMGIVYQFSILDGQVPASECFGSLLTKSWSWELGSVVDAQVLLSKPWFRPTGAPDALQPSTTLVFGLDHEASARTPGIVWILDGQGRKTPCGRVDAEAAVVNGANLAVGFLNRRGTRLAVPAPEGRPLNSRAGKPLKIVVPSNSVEYCRATRDFNPNHTNAAFARYSGWREPIVQGNQTAALLLRLIRQEIPGASVATMRRYDIDFCAVVYQGDVLNVSVRRSGMRHGNSLFAFTVQREESDEVVLTGQIELAPPATAYLFTGQGSQFAGMGLDLISQSKAARQIWTEAEEYFEKNWGFSLIDIVRRNPKTLTVNFGSRQGMRVRQTYLEVQEMFQASQSQERRYLFPGLHAKSRTYQFQHEEGILSMTQFAQPAILVLERAAFEHLRQQGRVPDGSCFAGHSLGEFAALGCMTRAMSLAASLRTVFVRGTLMQMAVPRDSRGRSGYAMAAVDPTRVRLGFGEPQLEALVARVAARTGLLLELVNRNVRGRQYVCAGDRRALRLLRAVTDALHVDAAVPDDDALLASLAPACVATAAADTVLTSGRALIPLPGIDVPFHSSRMAAMGELFRHTLVASIDKDLVRAADLTGRWIPNVTGRPFAANKAYLDHVVQLTGSPRLKDLVARLAA